MCEQTQVSYLQGDVVWVKLGPCWWPGEVQDMNKLPEEIKEDLGDATIAAIKFFEEDKFEYVNNLDHICLYNCRRKMEFIKKGLDMYRTKKKEGSIFMDKFPDDVARAEELTGGDPQILANNEFAPKEKTLWKDIFYEEKKQKSSLSSPVGNPRNAKNSNSKISSPNGQQKVSLPRRITHPRFLKVLKGETIDHEVRIRQQPGNLINPPNVPLNPYSCPSCNFTSFRINVIILHNKYHHATNASQSKTSNRTVKGRKSGVSGSRGRTKVKQLDSLVTESLGKSFAEEDKNILNNETKLIDTVKEKGIDKKSEKKVIFGSKRKGFKKLDHASKKKKSNEEIREKLLADWEDDDDDEQEEQELQMLKQVISKNTPTAQSADNSKVKEISCFDFDESADSMLDTELEERAKRFAENLKFPRILEDKGDTTKSKTFDSRHSLEKTKNSLNHPDMIDDSCHIVKVSSNEASNTFTNDTSPDISENSNGKDLTEVQSVITLIEPTTDSSNEVSIICEDGVQDNTVIGNREECSVPLGSSDVSNEIPTDIFSSNLQPNLGLNEGVKSENAPILATNDKEMISDLEAQFESVMAETEIPSLPEIPKNRMISDIGEENSMVLVSGSSDHDYSTRIKEAHKDASSDQDDPNNRGMKSTTQTYSDNDMELDINALPVVVADALIKNEHVTKSIKDGDINLSSVKQMHTDESSGISSGELNSQSCSTPANVVKVIKSTQKSNVGTIDSGSQYVIIQQSSSQQGRFPAKAIQQCVAVKTMVQQQSPSKKVVIVTPQGQIQHDAVHQSGPNKFSTITQRVITSSGSIVTTAVPSKTILQKGATLVSVPQQQIKILSGGGKHVLGSKLMMQSTQTKVSLPSMQTLQKVSVVQTAAGRISGGVTKSKGSTILIQTAPGTISTVTKTISTVGSPTQTLPRLQMARSKQQASPSGTPTVQRTILNATSSASSTTQPTMIIQRLQGSRTANVLVSNEQAKKVTGIFPRSHVLQRTVVPSTVKKIGPISQQKSAVISSGQVKGRIVIQSTKQKVGSLQPSLGDIDQTRQLACTLPTNTNPSQQVTSSSSSNINLTTGTNPSTTILTSEQLAQIMGPTAGQIAAEPGTLVFVTINETGNIEPIDNSTLVAYDTTDSTINKAANALYIDSSFNSPSNVDKLIFTLNDQNLDDNASVAHTLSTSFNTTNSKRPSTGSNQDILAAAIANTDVFQHEVSGCSSLSGSHTDSSSGILGTSTMLLPSLSNPGISLAAPGVLETSLTLSQAPIMTPLEVPSAITNLHSPPPPPSSTSLQLAQSLVLPDTSYSSVHFSSDKPSSHDSSNSTVVKTLPGFQTSMPLLSEDVGNTASIANIGVSTSSLTYTNVSGGITCSEASQNPSVTYDNFSTPFSEEPDSVGIAGDDFGTSLPSYVQVSESASTELEKDPSSMSFAPMIKDSANVMSTIQPVEATQVYLQSLDSTSDSVPLHVSTSFSSQSDPTVHGEQLGNTSQPIPTNGEALLQNLESAENSSTSAISESNQDSTSQCWMERETNAALSERLQYKLSER